MKILLIRLSSLGDIILTTPLLQELRRKYPEAKLDFLVRKEFAGIARTFPWLNEIHVLDTLKGREEIQRMNDLLKANEYDHVLDLHNNIRSRILRKNLSKNIHVIKKRIVKRWLLVTFKINLLKNDPDIIGRYFETARELEITDNGEKASFGREYKNASIRKAAICPGAQHWNKRWLPEYYERMCKELIAHGYRLEFFGSKEEEEYIKHITAKLPAGSITVYCGIDLSDLPESIAECSIAITNDSGLMHVATAAGISTISLFGPTVREFGFFPRAQNAIVLENTNLECRPCTTVGLDHCPKGHFRCMQEITPEIVIEKAFDVIARESLRTLRST